MSAATLRSASLVSVQGLEAAFVSKDGLTMIKMYGAIGCFSNDDP